MNNKNLSWLSLQRFHPLNQPLLIRVAADALQLLNPRFYLNGFSKQAHRIGSFQQGPSQRTIGLIPYKKDGTLLPPQIMFEMVADSARFAHTGGRQDHFGVIIKIDGLGFVAGNGQFQPGKADGIDAILHQFHSFLVKTALHIPVKN